MNKKVKILMGDYQTLITIQQSQTMIENIHSLFTINQYVMIDYIIHYCKINCRFQNKEGRDMEATLPLNYLDFNQISQIEIQKKDINQLMNEYFVKQIQAILGSNVFVTGYQKSDLMFIEIQDFPTINKKKIELFISYPIDSFEQDPSGITYHPIHSFDICYYQEQVGKPIDSPYIDEDGHPIKKRLRHTPVDLLVEVIYMITKANLDENAYYHLDTLLSKDEFIKKYHQECDFITSQLLWNPNLTNEYKLKKELQDEIYQYINQLMKDQYEVEKLSNLQYGFSNQGKDRAICEDYAISNQNKNYQLAIVTDGAGGMKQGYEASRLIAKDLYAYIEKNLDDFLYNNLSVIKNNIIIEINRILDDKALQLGCSRGDLASTMMITYKGLDGKHLVIHLGDGLILEKKEAVDDLLEVSAPDNGTRLNTTYLTGMDDLYEHIHIYRWNQNDIEYLIMLTDGAYSLVTKKEEKYHYSLNCEPTLEKMHHYLNQLSLEDDYSVVINLGGRHE